MSGADRFRADGSYRSNDGKQKLVSVHELADRIDGGNLTRTDSMALHAAISLLANVVSRQAGYTPPATARPGRWKPLGEYGRITEEAAS